MKIGVPTEIKPQEGRVALIPEAAAQLVSQGHEVSIQSQAGELSGYSDDDYLELGVKILPDAQSLYKNNKLIVKVKEPIEPDLALLTNEHILFSYLHLAALPVLTQRLCSIGLKAIAFETVQISDGKLPLLAPMSDIAGRLSVQIGTHLLHTPMGGKGLLLGGVPASQRGKVVILGGGMAGGNAAHVAANLGAEVVVFDRNRDKMETLRNLGHNVTALYPHKASIQKQIKEADLVIGAVLVVGEKAPHLVTEYDVKQMQTGSVIIDISVDQGGCIETTRPTNFDSPTFEKHGVTHFGVTNMPGSVPATASQALSASLIPFLSDLANSPDKLTSALQSGVNIDAGEIIHPALK
ncbi:MAG: alanine dehydrogenase [gamma proteobacterium symbiont of Bathyaustriella thionipta]|nr:alanine dehydrogenase [gamma proteobacterium symbiont of Bathyaustriella thionipta]MCU7948489.1 alanine dehydrogenase [gamma proteobacterium symbiont of Bathyaustriella thionipta]MCU7952713.1 alanine dehydrogenase [gamma proteobacterium symbiont of Bathyaustriella thionipta]MCU7955489.1 alanine dehydrogenase [gamma proteobacterium symbiont of Bathyaustriella thionipta]MCU7966356.1 alanine dehydrogenase [gamma proteobacterium symbiont of Bathyaustriella thionipta]